MSHSSAYLLEERRLAEIAERTAALKLVRETAERSGKRKTPAQRRALRIANPTKWIDDVEAIIIKIGRRLFTLGDLRGYEGDLERLHPESQDVMPAVRAALQRLRERGLVVFVDNNGTYIYKPFEKVQ